MPVIRRNVAHISAAERAKLRDAFIALDSNLWQYPDGTTYWDKQNQIHQATHVHGGPAFLPWHRELCNRLEALLQGVDPTLALHYWDWTTDPRNSPDGVGGFVDLFTSDFMGSPNGDAGAPFANFESTEFGHAHIWRSLSAGAPITSSDCDIVSSADASSQANQYHDFRVADSGHPNSLENVHNYIHGYIGGTIGSPHHSFHDPFVFLLHSNVDRLFASWQLANGFAWRLDPTLVYGIEGGSSPITDNLEPWAGGSGLRPWAPPDNQQVAKTSKDPSVVAPPAYDSYATCGLIKLKWKIEVDVKHIKENLKSELDVKLVKENLKQEIDHKGVKEFKEKDKDLVEGLGPINLGDPPWIKEILTERARLAEQRLAIGRAFIRSTERPAPGEEVIRRSGRRSEGGRTTRRSPRRSS
jgi:hypothetical protein